jgi:hypothetical protein
VAGIEKSYASIFFLYFGEMICDVRCILKRFTGICLVGMNNCSSCLEKQRKIDELTEEVTRLRQALGASTAPSQGRLFRFIQPVVETAGQSQCRGERNQRPAWGAFPATKGPAVNGGETDGVASSSRFPLKSEACPVFAAEPERQRP